MVATEALRTGECTVGCGACCRLVRLQVNPIYMTEKDTQRWLRLHGITLEARDRAVWANIPMHCLALTDDGKCSVVGTPEKPQLCEAWPSSQADVSALHDVLGEEACTYKFV